jgi:hypothetical protein
VTDHGALTGLGDDDHPQYLKTGGGALSGNLTAPMFGAATPAGAEAGMYILTGGTPRWLMGKNTASEGTGDVGADFAFARFHDNGAWAGNAIEINRASGGVTLEKPVWLADPVPTFGNHAASKQYVDSRGGGTVTNADVAASVAGAPVGSIIRFGTATPTAGIGAVGEFYLDTDDRVLYGPKSGTYGSGVSVVGTTPGFPNSVNASARTFGMRFTADVSGRVTRLRFWRAASATAVSRRLGLWNGTDGTKYADVASTADTGSGWITVTLPKPVPVFAGVTYIVGYDVAAGDLQVYSAVAPVSVSSGLTAGQATNYAGAGYGLTSTNAPGTNYFADIVFEPEVSGAWPVALKSPPPGGTTGQVLKKLSNADFDWGWVT